MAVRWVLPKLPDDLAEQRVRDIPTAFEPLEHLQIHGVDVDLLPTEIAGPFLEEALDRALVSEGVHVAPVEVVILTKLLRMISRDETDVVELIKAGLFEPGLVEGYLATHTPMLVRRFTALCQRAAKEKAYGA